MLQSDPPGTEVKQFLKKVVTQVLTTFKKDTIVYLDLSLKVT